MTNCPFCDMSKIWPAGILYRDSEIIATHSASINIPGYSIIYPVRHVTSFDELSASELTKIMRLGQAIVKTLKEYGAPRTYLCSFGELVNHFHLHIVPRYKDMADIPEILTSSGGVDGAKLFSYVQQHFKTTGDNLLHASTIVEIIAILRDNLSSLSQL